MKDVSVSLIIPCYRDAATLGTALDSVLSQTHPITEIIVVNDASPETAGIEGVLGRYPGVKYLKNENNLGLAATRNVGIYAASGDVVTFLDADDQLHPQKTELQLKHYEAGVAVSCRVAEFPEHIVRVETEPIMRPYKVQEFTDPKSIIFRNRITGASIMASRETLLRYGAYDETLRSCEDFELWLRLLASGVIVRDLQAPLYLYRQNRAGLSKRTNQVSAWELEALRRHFTFGGRRFLESRDAAIIWCFWLLKHCWRFEAQPDGILREKTRANITLLAEYPVLMTVMRLVEKYRLLWPLAQLNRVRKHVLSIRNGGR